MDIFVKTEVFQFDTRAREIEYSLINVHDFIARDGMARFAYNLENMWFCRTPEMAKDIGASAPFTAVEFH